MKVYTGSNWVAAYASLSGALLVANNLSDLNNTTSARTNLGLGSIATLAAPSGTVVGTSDSQTLTNKTLTAPTIDNIKMGYSTTATAAGTTTLTASSNYRQLFTGTNTQTIVLPVTSTLVTGMSFEIENNSTGNLTVNSSGGNLVTTIIPGTCSHLLCIGTSLTTAADWDSDTISFSTLTGTGKAVLDTSPTINTSLSYANQAEIRFLEATANGSNYVGFKAPASLSADKIWTLPSADGSANQAIITNGSGTLSFATLNPTLSYSSGTASGNGSTTAFTISSGRAVDDVLVFVNGFQLTPTTDYTISGTTLTFTTAPANSAEITYRYLPIPGTYTSANFTGNGSATTITIDSGRTVNDVLVVVNGLTLVPTDDYTISGTTLTFATAPANLAEITVRYLRLS